MKIKFTCNWCSDQSLYLRILNNYAINSEYFNLLTFKDDYDYLVIINDINDKSKIKNYEKTIGLAMEPSWHNWNKDLYKLCKLVMFHDKTLYNHDNVVEWTNCGFMHDMISYETFFSDLPFNMRNPINKNKDVSFVCGEFNDSQLGYKLRKDLLSKLEIENEVVDLYGRYIQHEPSKKKYGNLKLKYLGLLDYKFSICIENSFEKGYVSEKLYDCFVCDTVPIYCGTPNILDIFNNKNLIKVSNLEEILNVIEKIKNKEIKYEDFDIQSAKQKYLTELNLITQVLNIINKI